MLKTLAAFLDIFPWYIKKIKIEKGKIIGIDNVVIKSNLTKILEMENFHMIFN